MNFNYNIRQNKFIIFPNIPKQTTNFLNQPWKWKMMNKNKIMINLKERIILEIKFFPAYKDMSNQKIIVNRIKILWKEILKIFSVLRTIMI